MPTDPVTESLSNDHAPKPRIIPRSEHRISRKDIDREALKVLYRLRDAGHTAYLVGGGVRDLYLGKKPKDFDISTDARPGQLRKIFRNSRLIGRRFRLVQVFFHGGKIIEVSTFRRRSEFDLDGVGGNAGEKVLAANNTYGTPSDDAFRRDLTINGLFYEIENNSIIDFTGGVDDLEKGLIRLIGEPAKRVRRDPARMMRIIRHAARNGFAIEPTTWQAIIDHKEMLGICPISRIRDELMKDLRSGVCATWSKLAMDSGLFYVLFPFYRSCQNSPAGSTNLNLFVNIQAVVDRITVRSLQLPDQLLFSLLLLPWAMAEYDLVSRHLKGAEFHKFLKMIRTRLDEILGPMSIKRAHKESIALNLTTLPQFIRFARENSWPRWLKRKSYYQECDLFFRIYSEASDGKPVPDKVLTKSLQKLRYVKRPKTTRKKRYRKKKTPGPAFAGKKNGGVFGLKK